ncbi:MAG: hypothetical protein JXX14_19255 [Deltaproteobacteria bacterium]|nr:hypothetical protein [Deltaproteobacteria bacterium]
MNKNKTIICDACTDFAKATLDGRNLCAGCLLRELMSARDASLFERLTPLPNEIESHPPPQA